MVSITPRSRTVATLITLFFGLLFGLLLALQSSAVRADSLSASVDRTQLALDETLTLSLRFDSRDADGEPDISALEPFFEVLGRSQSRQLRSINGKTSSFTQWQYSLAPKQQGRILIPAFELQGARSQPLQVQVTAPQVSPNSQGGEYFLERNLEPQTLYPGQQLRVRLRLNTTVGLSELQISPLSVAGAKLVELEDSQYQRTLNGRPYLVYEKNYALFPQQPGTLELPAQVLSAVKGGSRSLFGLNRGQTVRLRSDAQRIEVKAPPAGAGSDWLPAAAVKLQQWLETGITTVYAGEPVTLNLRLDTEGADPARLPALTPPTLDGVKVYPEPVDERQQNAADNLQITRTQRVGLVPTQPGTLTLPASRVRWWNSRSGQFETAQSAPISLTVLPPRQGSVDSPSAAVPPAALTAPLKPAATPADTPAEPQVIAADSSAANTPWLLWSNLIWAILCTLLAAAWWRARRHPSAPRERPGDTAAAPTTQQADQQLQQVCQHGDPQAIRSALLRWAETHKITGRQPATLDRIAALGDVALQRQLAALDRALFAPQQADAVDTQQLLASLHGLRSAANPRPPRSGSLAELYPQ